MHRANTRYTCEKLRYFSTYYMIQIANVTILLGKEKPTHLHLDKTHYLGSPFLYSFLPLNLIGHHALSYSTKWVFLSTSLMFLNSLPLLLVPSASNRSIHLIIVFYHSLNMPCPDHLKQYSLIFFSNWSFFFFFASYYYYVFLQVNFSFPRFFFFLRVNFF